MENRIRGHNAALPSMAGMTTSRRRWRLLLGTVLAVSVAATAYAAPRHETRASLSTDGWPRVGQGAYVVGDGPTAASAHQHPAPIASLAKVMTAYLVLKHHPLRTGESGRRFVVGERDVADTERRRGEGQSILLPSANNVAVLVARQVDGSVAAFVAEMNRTAHALGMAHTTYTDPSGYDAGTVSTALDQLRLARVVARDATLAAVMATRSAWLPVAGVVTNTNTLLGRGGFVGMKTGSDAAAGGCFMFRSGAVIGVVLGQQGPNLIAAGLDAAQQLVANMPQAKRNHE
jgi:D-alanyl-D-alanine carboxypeptidase (penicillin-binding protein 5/6)